MARLAICGCGEQALENAEAIADMRPICSIAAGTLIVIGWPHSPGSPARRYTSPVVSRAAGSSIQLG